MITLPPTSAEGPPGFYWFYLAEWSERPKSAPRWVVVEVCHDVCHDGPDQYVVRLPGRRHMHTLDYMERYVGRFGPYLAPPPAPPREP